MKTIFAAALMAAVNAKAHKYFAESNFACGMCEQAVTLANKKAVEELAQIYELFPKLEEIISEFSGNEDLIDLTKPELTCQNLGLCAKPTVAEMLLSEMPVDLE